MRRFLSFLVTALAATTLLGLVACQTQSPEEQVAEKRAQYTVTLNSWFARVDNVAMEEEDAVGEMDEAEAEGEAPAEDESAMPADDLGEGEETAEEPLVTGPQPHTIVFDLLVLYDGRGAPLPGVTVEVTHAGSDGQVKDTWLEFLAVPSISKGTSKQVGIERPGVLFEQGDVFAVDLKKSVPAEERSGYQEFQSAGN